jgi:NADH-quinone oxidoreductase subunit C
MSLSLEQLVEQFSRLIATAAPAPSPAAAAPASSAPALVGEAAAKAATTAPPPTAAVTAPAAAPASPIKTTEHAQKGYDLDVTVAREQIVEAAKILDRAGFSLDTITGVDWLAQNEMEVVYDFLHFTSPLRVVIRTRTPRATPEVPTILGVYPGANWHERETHDFFGIKFTGHPNLTPFLLPEDADYHPLRKDYKP